jgi:hypothetical protein
MAYGAEPPRGETLAHTMYVRPSRALIARSWHWPDSWHGAYEQATTNVAQKVAACVLNGLSIVQHLITMELPAGRISFCVTRWDRSIYIAVSDFEGPDDPEPTDPGPKGGTRQPNAADGVVLGLRGTGKNFTIVTFCGYLRPAAAGAFPAARFPGQVLSWGRMEIGDVVSVAGSISKPAAPGARMADTTKRKDSQIAVAGACMTRGAENARSTTPTLLASPIHLTSGSRALADDRTGNENLRDNLTHLWQRTRVDIVGNAIGCRAEKHSLFMRGTHFGRPPWNHPHCQYLQ